MLTNEVTKKNNDLRLKKLNDEKYSFQTDLSCDSLNSPIILSYFYMELGFFYRCKCWHSSDANVMDDSELQAVNIIG